MFKYIFSALSSITLASSSSTTISMRTIFFLRFFFIPDCIVALGLFLTTFEVLIESQILKAILAFYDVYAIGEDSESTPAEVEGAMTNCFINLSGHMSRVAAYAKTRHGIKSPPESWKQFGLLSTDSIEPSYVPGVQYQQPIRSNISVINEESVFDAAPDEITGKALSQGNNRKSGEIDRPIASQSSLIPSLSVDNDDDDNCPYQLKHVYPHFFDLD